MKAIFNLFLENTKLKFSEIEKKLKIRSNKLAYHLDKMVSKGLLEKKNNYYFLTKNAEKYLPINENLNPLPVVLVGLINDRKILLIKREKRPYKGYWSLIGGKMLFEESFEDSALRLVKKKAGLNCKIVSINSVLHERVKDEGVKHSFILFFVKAKCKFEKVNGNLKWFSLNDLKNVIPSDLWLIKNKLNSKIDVKKGLMKEKKGKLSGFRVI